MSRPLNILAYLHIFVPEHCAGSEVTLYSWFREFVKRGHRVRIMCDRSMQAPYTIDGIEIIRPPRRGQESWIEQFAKDADVIVTHLDLSRPAMRLALVAQKPIIHAVHNDAQLVFHNVNPTKCQLAVFNSEWIAKKEVSWMYGEHPKVWQGPSITIHPVVEPERYVCERGEGVTLVNPTPGKGAATFYALARLMPDVQFYAVTGGYGEQIPPPHDLHNVEVIDHTPDIREVFRKTKVLLMPSDYESYGRVGIEAACAGIPTIAHPTPGLTEAFGDAGIFIDRNDIKGWYEEVERLLTDEIHYQRRVDAVQALAKSLDPESEFDRLEEAFINTVRAWEAKREVVMGKFWTADKKYWLTSEGKAVDHKTPDAVTLLVGQGGQLTEADAIKYGLLETKAIEKPDENKMVQPGENKAEAKAVGVKVKRNKAA